MDNTKIGFQAYLIPVLSVFIISLTEGTDKAFF